MIRIKIKDLVKKEYENNELIIEALQGESLSVREQFEELQKTLGMGAEIYPIDAEDVGHREWQRICSGLNIGTDFLELAYRVYKDGVPLRHFAFKSDRRGYSCHEHNQFIIEY